MLVKQYIIMAKYTFLQFCCWLTGNLTQSFGIQVYEAEEKCLTCMNVKKKNLFLVFSNFTIFTDYQGDYYGSGNYDFFPHGPPSSQTQSPADSNYLQNSGPGSTPLGPLEPPLAGHHPSENQRYADMISHPDTPSPEPGMTGSLHPISGEVFSSGPSPPFSMSSNSGFSGPLPHQNPDINEGTVW